MNLNNFAALFLFTVIANLLLLYILFLLKYPFISLPLQILPRPILTFSAEYREQTPGSPLADLQQFFTGKLYVLVYQLKLPAEELLWLALSWHVSTEMAMQR